MHLSLTELAKKISGWAATKKEIGEVWLFGSWARGENRPDSDLDVAIVMARPDRPKGDRYGDWIFLSSKWEAELQCLLPVKLDLDIGDADIAVNVVGPAIARDGVRLFSSEAKSK